MKRSLYTLALLAASTLPSTAQAQTPDAEAPKADDPPATESPEAEAPQPEAEQAPSEGEQTPPKGEATPEGEAAPEGEPSAEDAAASAEDKPAVDLGEVSLEEGKDGGRGPSGAGAAASGARGELTQGPPEPEFDPALEPEVYWEGDADPHNPGYVPGYGHYRGLGMNPNAPRAGAAPGGVSAPINSDTWDEDWSFNFHGYLESTLKAGFSSRENPADGQSETVIHATPIVPGRYGDFEASQSVPGPWTQLNFSYGNPYVRATVIYAGFNQQTGASYNYPASQLGINDAFITLNPPEIPGLRMKVLAGAYQDRYGAMAQYSDGNYGHSIVASTRGTGATLIGDFDVAGEVIGLFEVGFKGTLDKAPVGIEPTDATGYGDSSAGAGYIGHAHLGVAVGDWDISGHYLYAFTKDDRLPTVPIRPGQPVAGDEPPGHISTYGLTVRALGQRYGHFFIGGAHTRAVYARSVPRVINILNAGGGLGLMEEYLGMNSRGNGDLTHVGFQYDASLQSFLRYPTFFRSDSWDIRGSFFGTYVHVNSDQETTNLPGSVVRFDDVDKLKLGTEIMWNILPWLGVSTRYDFVGPDLQDSERAYQIVSPRIIFRTNFLAHEQINIRYTRWFYGDNVLIQTVAPNDPQGLDEHMLALQANMYW